MLLHHVKQAQDVPNPSERDALLAGQVLDDLHLRDVALRVAPPVGRRAMRLDEAGVPGQPESARVSLEDLPGGPDRVQRAVPRAVRLEWWRRRAGGASSAPITFS